MNTTAINQRTPGPEPQGTLTAFCAACPEPAKVTQVLQTLGFRLTLFLPADTAGEYMENLPPLPAQYHYEDEIGTRVEYLAGVDMPCLDDDEDDTPAHTWRRFPPHASRFWLTPGGRALTTRRAREALAEAFTLRWLDSLSEPTMEEVA